MARKPLVSVCIIARDEERSIGRAIRSVAGLADEVVLVDTGSADRTPEIARALGARVHAVDWHDDFAEARNAAIDRARGRWIVVLDADEYFTPAEARRLRKAIRHFGAEVSGASIRVVNTLVDDPTRVIDRANVFRVFRNTPAHRYVFPVHEQIVGTLADGLAVSLDVEFLHDGYDPGLTQERKKPERNLRLLTRHLETLGQDPAQRWYALMQIGTEHSRLGQPEQAVATLLEAVAICRQLPYNRLNRGSFSVLLSLTARNLIQLGRAAEARAIMDDFLARGWNLPSIWFGRGWASVELGDVAVGVRDFLWCTTLAETAGAAEDYSSDQELKLLWLLAVQALLRRGAPEAAAALLVHALRHQPGDGRLVAQATALAQEIPSLGEFLVTNLPAEAVWPFARQAASEERHAIMARAATRLGAEKSPFAPVAEGLVAMARGERGVAERLWRSVSEDSPAWPEARFALDRLARPDRRGAEEVVVA